MFCVWSSLTSTKRVHMVSAAGMVRDVDVWHFNFFAPSPISPILKHLFHVDLNQINDNSFKRFLHKAYNTSTYENDVKNRC